MSEPREWWLINRNEDLLLVACESKEKADAIYEGYQTIYHVIEKSAYDQLKEKLRIANEACDDSLAMQKDIFMAQANALAEALEKISSSKNMTRLADCCVDRSCHINAESNSCSFQTGVHYGNSDRAAEADKALKQWQEWRDGK